MGDSNTVFCLTHIYLQNSTLPSNSQVLLIGLAQGDVMFKYMQDKIHPVGSFRGDVTYKSLYEFLTCLQV